MSEFVQAKGQTLKSSSKVFNKQMPTIVVKAQETPKQAMERRKREAAEAEFQLKSKAAGAQLMENQQNKVQNYAH